MRYLVVADTLSSLHFLLVLAAFQLPDIFLTART